MARVPQRGSGGPFCGLGLIAPGLALVLWNWDGIAESAPIRPETSWRVRVIPASASAFSDAFRLALLVHGSRLYGSRMHFFANACPRPVSVLLT
jgi:hypothetical protein